MADTTKTTKQLKLVAGFEDGDERTITIENPKDNITAEQIKALNAKAAMVLVGDKYGAPFSIFKDAGIYLTTQVDLDLQSQD